MQCNKQQHKESKAAFSFPLHVLEQFSNECTDSLPHEACSRPLETFKKSDRREVKVLGHFKLISIQKPSTKLTEAFQFSTRKNS